MIPKYIKRHFAETDRNFIRSTFQTVHHLANTHIAQELYIPEQTKIIDHLLSYSNTLIACFPEDPETIMGYIIYDLSDLGLILHWYHIKSPYRQDNILLNELLSYIYPNYNNELVMMTHNSPNRQPDNFVFNSYLIRKYLK
jgi:hypothetical protein